MEYLMGDWQDAKCRKSLPYRVGQEGCGCIYAIEFSTDYVKIGSTKNPKNRFSCLERDVNYSTKGKLKRFILSHPFKGYKNFEFEVHKRLESFRKPHTELFKISLYQAETVITTIADEFGTRCFNFETGINNLNFIDEIIVRSFLERSRQCIKTECCIYEQPKK